MLYRKINISSIISAIYKRLRIVYETFILLFDIFILYCSRSKTLNILIIEKSNLKEFSY